MRINRFAGEGIHGYLNFSINFFPDINFLTGINGSGKTSVVNGISALISPSLVDLAKTDYRRMEVEVETDDGKAIIIWAKKEVEKVTIGSSQVDHELEFPVLSDDMFDFMSGGRAREEQATFYREQEAKLFDDPVLKSIKGLPTPMVLDIERRLSRLYDKRSFVVQSGALRRSNVFKLSLHRSLADASNLAEFNFRQIKALKDRLTDDFRKKIILSSIEFEHGSTGSPKSFPTLSPEFFERKDEIKKTLLTLGLTKKEIDNSLEPFFKRLQDLSKIMPADGNVEDLFSKVAGGVGIKNKTKNSKEASKKVQLLVDWLVNSPQYYRLIKIKNHVDEYIKNNHRLYEPINKYLDTVNQYLNDSGKEIQFSETSNLLVKFKKGDDRPITSLASGESQIVVILTHLFFNPDAKTANVFIIDEPELSLHVRWQELFVDSVRTASPNLQLILATHSPSIILEDEEHCIDLSGGQDK